ncbi:MAG: RimK family alpha-L-glutamate ligase [Deltaproteobacteria bacterium]|nr:RimK family alpha-L-glutamate ligase [Deltaproteobacteria bacterium]
MRILILSRRKSFYSTRRIIRAARRRSHDVLVADPLEFYPVISRHRPSLYYRGESMEGIDLVIPRIGVSITPYGLALVRQFDMMGIPVLNNAIAIARSRDKLRSLQLLTKRDIDVPTTVCARSPTQLEHALHLVGGPPCIIKMPQGTHGVGVMIAETRKGLESLVETLWGMGHAILIQQYIASSRGRDVRVIVIGGRVVAAMRRTPAPGEFRSNLHRGGEGQPIDLEPAYARAAIAATKVIGLEVAGVDILETPSGPKILEVNSSPGLEGIEKTTRVGVAEALVRHGEKYVRTRRRRRRRGRGSYPGREDAVITAERRRTPRLGAAR